MSRKKSKDETWEIYEGVKKFMSSIFSVKRFSLTTIFRKI
jgi:hypothetical protein